MADTNSTALALKIVFVFIFFFLALAAGIIPAKSTRCKANQTLLGVANSFAAGVFMAIAFMHILPEAVGDYSEIMEDGKDEGDSDDDDNGPFPLPYLLYFIGYTFILIVDRVVFDSHGVYGEDHHGEHGHDAEDPAE